MTQQPIPDITDGQTYGCRMGLVADRILEGHLIEVLEIELAASLRADVGDAIASEVYINHHFGADARRTYDQLVTLSPGMADDEKADRILVGPRCLLVTAVCVFTTRSDA